MASTIQQVPFMYDDEISLISARDLCEGTLSPQEASSETEDVNTALLGDKDPDGNNVRSGKGRGEHGDEHYESTVLSEQWRFCQLVVCTFCCLAVSSSYAFNLYSGQLQSKYNFTQNDITTITTISDVVGGFSLPFGVLYDYYGATPIFFVALLSLPTGSIFFGLTFANTITGSIPLFALYACLQSVGVSMLDLGSVMTMLSIFPVDRGSVVAVMKTFSGMGSAILGAIHLAFFSEDNDNDTSRFFYFLAALTAGASFLGVLFIDVPPYIIRGCEVKSLTEDENKARHRLKKVYLSQKAPVSRFAFGFAIVVVLMIFLPTQGALSAYFNLSHAYHVVFAGIAVALFACYPIMALPLKCFGRKLDDAGSDEDSTEGYSGPIGPLGRLSRRFSRASGMSRANRISRASRRSRDSIASVILKELEFIAPQYQTTFLQNLLTLRYWALLWTLFCLTGCQVIVIGNSRFLFTALSNKPLSDSFISLLVVLSGVGSGLGRIFLSFLEVISQNRAPEERIPISFILFVPVSFAMASLSLLLLVSPSALPLPAMLMALANGSTAAGIVIVIRAIYVHDIAKLYNVCMIAGMCSSVLMNRLLYAEWYTRQAEKQGSTICYGKVCVNMPILVCLGMILTTAFSTLYIHWDYAKFCKKMLEEREYRRQKRQAEKLDALNQEDDSKSTHEDSA